MALLSRPRRRIGLTAVGEELVPRGYGALLLGVLDLLCEWDGPGATAACDRSGGRPRCRFALDPAAP